MSALDQTLANIRAALATPFADPANVAGLSMPRATARAMERGLLREKKTPRRVLPQPTPRAAAKDGHQKDQAGPPNKGLITPANARQARTNSNSPACRLPTQEAGALTADAERSPIPMLSASAGFVDVSFHAGRDT